MTDVKQTVYHNIHIELGAKMAEFAGYSMPMQYEGSKAEHMAVREAAGLFDVSHMGEIEFRGPGAQESIDYMVSNDVISLAPGHALYTPIVNHQGGIVDDCIVYKRSATDILVVVNASNAAKDFAWFKKHSPSVVPVDISDDIALLALQGPQAEAILAKASKAQNLCDIPGFGLGTVTLLDHEVMVARTGYTGEDGFEIFLPSHLGPAGWKLLMEVGRDLGLKPAGLGARDTLRLEARLWLYGNDIDDTTTPLEAGMAFAVKLDAGDFIGKEILVKQKQEKVTRRLIGFRVTGKGIPRHGHTVHTINGDGTPGDAVGHVTSGTKVPFINETVGMAYIPRTMSTAGNEILINVRDKMVSAVIVKGPFYKRS
ncbi:glycine cleavage system aminomethyltransferase GcvT [Myxococcota bacterium]|nr:glycine cleavage system aminomethyltransferase GcvT [Myxococcota bacterium]MBU1536536.1 glycine cleavage system aminomethyltransferase GcvT [Myxococcota bacterium]